MRSSSATLRARVAGPLSEDERREILGLVFRRITVSSEETLEDEKILRLVAEHRLPGPSLSFCV